MFSKLAIAATCMGGLSRPSTWICCLAAPPISRVNERGQIARGMKFAGRRGLWICARDTMPLFSPSVKIRLGKRRRSRNHRVWWWEGSDSTVRGPSRGCRSASATIQRKPRRRLAIDQHLSVFRGYDLAAAGNDANRIGRLGCDIRPGRSTLTSVFRGNIVVDHLARLRSDHR